MSAFTDRSETDLPVLAGLADRWARMPEQTARLDRLRARTLTITSALGVACTLALAAIAYRDALAHPMAMLISAMGMIGVVVAPFWLRRTKRPAQSGVIFCLSITVALGVWPLAMGGVTSPFMPVLISLPLLFALMAGARAAAAITLGLLVYAPLCLLVTPSDVGMPVHGVLGHNHFSLLVLMVAAVMVGAAAATSTLITARAMRLLEAESTRSAELVEESEIATQRFRMFADVASDWLWETDSTGRVTFFAGALAEQMEWPENGPIGEYFMDLLELRSDDAERLRDLVARAQPYANIPVRLVDAVGGEMIFEISATPIFDEQGACQGYMGVGRDVTARVRAENDVRFLAENDKLTGLANRHTFNIRLNEQLAPEVEHGAALFAIDLDEFKAVNDTYGHHVGDALLVEVAARINSSIRKGDWAARLGGDEFIVMSVGYDPDKWDVDLVADRLMKRLAAPYQIEELELYVSASIGVARYPHDADNSRDLTKYADLALYAAKEGGRNQWREFTPAMEQTATQRKLLETGLRGALENSELDVWYQPFVDLDSERVAGFEALARWTDADRGYIPPNLFIDVAEKCGLINDLGAYVLQRACSDAASWTTKDDGPLPRVSVNISAVQFADGSLPETVAAVLKETGLAPSRLELEITESILMDDLEVAVTMLESLEQLGVSVAIDDFGTGYSSLSYLKRFPLNRLKVDRSFIQDLESDENDRTITQTVLKLGESLGLAVIAEGVETAGQRDWLESMGCREVQGYLFAKPMPATETAAYLSDPGLVAATVDAARKKTA